MDTKLAWTFDWFDLGGPLAAVDVPVVGAEVVHGPGERLRLKAR